MISATWGLWRPIAIARGAPCIEHLHVTSSLTSPTVAAILEVFFSRRAGRFNGNNVVYE
jgi:hypothetical protein